MTNNENKESEKTKTKSRKNKITDNAKYYTGIIDDKIMISSRIILNLKEDKIEQERMALFGYNQEKIQSFDTAHSNTFNSICAQANARSYKMESHADFVKLFAVAQAKFRCLVKVARIALSNDLLSIDKLKLSVKRGRSISDSFTFMDSFYTQTLSDNAILAHLAGFGYSIDQLKTYQQTFLTAKEAYSLYCIKNALSNEVTRQLHQNLARLDSLMSEYFALSKLAELK